MTDGHRCPVPGCDLIVAPDKLLCRGHWYRVDRTTRAELWAAWRNRQAHPREQGAIARHRAAMAAATRAASGEGVSA